MRGFVAVIVAVVAVTGCSQSQPATTSTSPIDLPSTPVEVVEVLLAALGTGDIDRAVAVTDRDQIPLVALAEGAPARDVAAMTADDLDAVAANFWSGFAGQFGAAAGADIGDLRIRDDVGEVTVIGSRFALVEVVRGTDASVRTFVIRDTPGGWVVDLVASFPSPLLAAVPDAAAAVRQTGDDELRRRIDGLEGSILVVLDDPDTPAQLNQAAIAALEAIER